jgi:hypothetical protein
MNETGEETLDQVVAPAPSVESLLPEEIIVLWRQRLRLAAWLLFAGFAIFVIRRVLEIWLGGAGGSAAESYLFWSQAAITAILGLFGILLSSSSPSTQFRLCTAEFALFGFPTVLFLTSQYFITLRACDEWGIFSFSAGPWLLLIFTYALFIPSTSRRAALVIGAIAAAPILLVLVMSWQHPRVAGALTVDELSGLVHRDIKPANLFISQRGGVYDVVKVLDFGLVKPIAEDQPVHLTADGMLAGSPHFMSPEQAVGDASTDARSDIYSLGASAYYLLTGQPPFRGDNVLKLVVAHANELPTPPSRHNGNIPNDLEQIILKCLAKDRSERFQNIAELQSALAQCEAAGRWSREKAAEWWQSREPSRP